MCCYGVTKVFCVIPRAVQTVVNCGKPRILKPGGSLGNCRRVVKYAVCLPVHIQVISLSLLKKNWKEMFRNNNIYVKYY